MMTSNARAVLVGLGTFVGAFFVSVVMLATTGGLGSTQTSILLVLSIVIGVAAGIVSHRRGRGDET